MSVLGRTNSAQRDYQEVQLHYVQRGIQTFALISPPLAVLSQLRRPTFRFTPIFRATGIATFGVGSAIGAGLGWATMRGMNDEGVVRKATKIKTDANQRREDDYAFIGGALGALTSTAILLRRVPIPWTLTGGAALGVAGGVLTHLSKLTREGKNEKVNEWVDKVKEIIDDD
ncbi:hypothetical protein BCR35DRAFT_282829 [Leucosporidium creatinivorum]|uniref:Transmembrane protein n=1 Tax=Leucosporidium creatinivorum TaxID=106004 RepID=A0A1Y2E608_9BASI|nr:hypothetical protein BCR35DRAFT_282829 [Leucosporidium creatinivorum]